MAGLKVVDINKVVPERKDPPRSSWILISEKTVGSHNLALGVNETEPGSMVPEHRHEVEEEVMLFLEGEGKFVTEDQEIALKPGICVYN
ncbi:MAG TPA: cupin domain-containing protein, partial [Magnetospirillaceae bacterium]|nr:cupin domain-containing protein [Magnetospirillaceae bacterium]